MLSHFSKAVCFILLLPFFLGSCASVYFKPVAAPEKRTQIENLGKLSGRDFWHGFVFNGEKVGFVHLKIDPIPATQQYRVSSEAHLRIRFLGMEKRIDIKSDEVVMPDLSLVSFHYEQKMEGKPLVLDGRVEKGILRVRQNSGGAEKTVEKVLSRVLYPSSVINFYPVLRGMGVGSTYRYDVYDPQTQSIAEVIQSVIAFEESAKLSLEPSFKVQTQMHGHRVSSWINIKGETIFETGMGGALITYREDEAQAKRFIAEASFNKKDLVFDFSLVKTDRPIDCPRSAVFMRVALWGLSGTLPLLRGPSQAFSEETIDGGPAVVFTLNGTAARKGAPPAEPLNTTDRHLYLQASHHLESDHPEIKKATAETVGGAATVHEKIERLVRWVSAEIGDEAVDSFSALEVLHRRKGECQAHTMLYTAMARAAGIPTKLAAGFVYVEGMGFLYHSWAESFSEGWVPVDPTYNQVGVDATHVKLVEGRDWTSLLQLANIIGQIRARVIDYSCANGSPPSK